MLRLGSLTQLFRLGKFVLKTVLNCVLWFFEQCLLVFIRSCNVSNCQSPLTVSTAVFHTRTDAVELMATDCIWWLSDNEVCVWWYSVWCWRVCMWRHRDTDMCLCVCCSTSVNSTGVTVRPRRTAMCWWRRWMKMNMQTSPFAPSISHRSVTSTTNMFCALMDYLVACLAG